MTTLFLCLLLFAFVYICAADIKQEADCTKEGGSCKYDTDCVNGDTLIDYCPKQASNIKCCVPKAVKQEEKCTAAGGTCKYDNECQDGTILKDHCPTQAGNIKCCVKKSTSTSGGGAAPSAPAATPAPAVADTTPECASMKAYCTNAAYKTMMATKCPKTCGTAPAAPAAQAAPAATPAPAAVDTTSQCASMKAYCTNAAYKTMMAEKCPKTCGTTSTSSGASTGGSTSSGSSTGGSSSSGSSTGGSTSGGSSTGGSAGSSTTVITSDCKNAETVFDKESETYGYDVVRATTAKIASSGIFPDDHGLLERIAWHESHYGALLVGKWDKKFPGKGGIWQIDPIVVEDNILRGKSKALIKEKLCVDTDKINRDAGDLTVPLKSAVMALEHLILLMKGKTQMPQGICEQAKFYRLNFNSCSGAGTPEKFMKSMESMPNKSKELEKEIADCKDRSDPCA